MKGDTCVLLGVKGLIFHENIDISWKLDICLEKWKHWCISWKHLYIMKKLIFHENINISWKQTLIFHEKMNTSQYLLLDFCVVAILCEVALACIEMLIHLYLVGNAGRHVGISNFIACENRIAGNERLMQRLMRLWNTGDTGPTIRCHVATFILQ